MYISNAFFFTTLDGRDPETVFGYFLTAQTKHNKLALKFPHGSYPNAHSELLFTNVTIVDMDNSN